MGVQLYDLARAEPERRFSPYCWRNCEADEMIEAVRFPTARAGVR
jgi:hypothetical protein